MTLSFPQDPMLARPVTALPEPGALDGGCVYEPKFDGYRALLFVGTDGCRVQSRRGHEITESFDDVARAAADQLPPGLVLDGELVVWSDGGLDFSALQHRLGRRDPVRRRRPASFVAFDALQVADTDVRSQSLSVRRQLLETAMAGADGPLQLSPQTDDVALARSWLADYTAADVGIEGLVVKGRASSYRGGTREWQKYRLRDTTEAVVGAVGGSLDGPEHLVLGRYDQDGELRMVGTTTGLDTTTGREVAGLLTPATAASHPWDAGDLLSPRWGRSSRRTVHLVEPALVVEVSTDSSTDRGRWRHPVRLVRVRPDLGTDEVPVIA